MGKNKHKQSPRIKTLLCLVTFFLISYRFIKMRYSAVFVAFMIGIGAVITAPAEPAKGHNTARLAVSANEVADTDKSYIVNKNQNYVIASEAKKKTSDQDSEDQSYQTYNRFKRLKSHDSKYHRHRRCASWFGACRHDKDCCGDLICAGGHCHVY